MSRPNDDITDEDAVLLTLKDKAFFGHLVMRYEDRLSRYILRLGVRNEEDREDILQEIFIKVYKNLNDFDTSLSFSSWIYRIAHNEAISWFRKKNVRPEGHLIAESDQLLSYIPDQGANQEDLFDRSVNAAAISDALQQLDPKYRSPLILRFFEHKEYEEISDILKIPSSTVGTLIHRGKKKLAELITVDTIRL